MPDEIELTELTDIQVIRQDAVKRPASGFRFLIQKSTADHGCDGQCCPDCGVNGMAKAVGANGQQNEKPDIAGANKVLALLAQLVASEAEELAAGFEDESCDIALLLGCMSEMRWFRERESMAAEMAKDIDIVNDLIAKRSKTKETSEVSDPVNKDAEGAPEETPAAAEPQADVLTKDVVAKMIADATAEFQGLREERDDALKELEVLKATPIPGAPYLTAPASAVDERKRSEAVSKAAYHRRVIETVSDPDLLKYHKAKLAEVETLTSGA